MYFADLQISHLYKEGIDQMKTKRVPRAETSMGRGHQYYGVSVTYSPLEIPVLSENTQT